MFLQNYGSELCKKLCNVLKRSPAGHTLMTGHLFSLMDRWLHDLPHSLSVQGQSPTPLFFSSLLGPIVSYMIFLKTCHPGDEEVLTLFNLSVSWEKSLDWLKKSKMGELTKKKQLHYIGYHTPTPEFVQTYWVS